VRKTFAPLENTSWAVLRRGPMRKSTSQRFPRGKGGFLKNRRPHSVLSSGEAATHGALRCRLDFASRGAERRRRPVVTGLRTQGRIPRREKTTALSRPFRQKYNCPPICTNRGKLPCESTFPKLLFPNEIFGERKYGVSKAFSPPRGTAP
jgi:hypothetical protein